MRRSLAGVLLVGALACAGREAESPLPSRAPLEAPGMREQGLLLLLADRRIYERYTVETIRWDKPQLRDRLAVTLGRVGDPRGRPVLEELLGDPRPEVRREAAFALGQLADPQSTDALLRTVRDSDEETAVWAVAALAELEAPLATVIQAAEGLPAETIWRRLLAYLFRFPPEQVLGVARQGLELRDPELRAMAVYALARRPMEAAAPALRLELGNPSPWVRGWAARGLGEVGDRTDLERLLPLLGDSDPSPIIQSLRAARRLIGRGVAAPADPWRAPLLALFEDPRPGVALSAMETASAWLLDAALGDALAQRVDSGGRREREVALLALAEGGDPRARDLVTRLAAAPEAHLRALAARAGYRLGDLPRAEALLHDSSPQVRAAALEGLLETEEANAARWVREALSDPDPGVRAAALEWLVEHPVAAVEEISRALVGADGRRVVELRLFGARALMARGLATPLERGLAVQNLESLARVGDYPVRQEAAAGLAELGRPRPAVGPAESQRTARTYTDIVRQTAESRFVSLTTRRGVLRLRLDCPEAPLTCLNFLQLARQGFYDGTVFHRVVPDFVIQGGDPRGDGWGGPGYTLRDEHTRRVFARGVIGMASSGPHTAGGQFFITLSRQPHLDGRYTAFGKVVEGDEVLDRIVQGDRIEALEVLP